MYPTYVNQKRQRVSQSITRTAHVVGHGTHSKLLGAEDHMASASPSKNASTPERLGGKPLEPIYGI